MQILSYILITLIVIWGIWFTYNKFKNIEKGKTRRQEHIDNEMKVKEKKKNGDRSGGG